MLCVNLCMFVSKDTNEKLAVKMCRLELTERNKDRWSREIQIMKKYVVIFLLFVDMIHFYSKLSQLFLCRFSVIQGILLISSCIKGSWTGRRKNLPVQLPLTQLLLDVTIVIITMVIYHHVTVNIFSTPTSRESQ